MLGMADQRGPRSFEIAQCLPLADRTIEKIVDAEIEKDEAVRELLQLLSSPIRPSAPLTPALKKYLTKPGG